MFKVKYNIINMQIPDSIKEQLKQLFSSIDGIHLAYLFGSQITSQKGPLSDYDFAVYFDDNLTHVKRNNLTLELHQKIAKIVKTDAIDLVVLNQNNNSILKFNIIKDGVLLYQKEPYKVIIEPAIMSEYFDFKQFLDKFI